MYSGTWSSITNKHGNIIKNLVDCPYIVNP